MKVLLLTCVITGVTLSRADWLEDRLNEFKRKQSERKVQSHSQTNSGASKSEALKVCVIDDVLWYLNVTVTETVEATVSALATVPEVQKSTTPHSVTDSSITGCLTESEIESVVTSVLEKTSKSGEDRPPVCPKYMTAPQVEQKALVTWQAVKSGFVSEVATSVSGQCFPHNRTLPAHIEFTLAKWLKPQNNTLKSLVLAVNSGIGATGGLHGMVVEQFSWVLNNQSLAKTDQAKILANVESLVDPEKGCTQAAFDFTWGRNLGIMKTDLGQVSQDLSPDSGWVKKDLSQLPVAVTQGMMTSLEWKMWLRAQVRAGLSEELAQEGSPFVSFTKRVEEKLDSCVSRDEQMPLQDCSNECKALLRATEGEDKDQIIPHAVRLRICGPCPMFSWPSLTIMAAMSTYSFLVTVLLLRSCCTIRSKSRQVKKALTTSAECHGRIQLGGVPRPSRVDNSKAQISAATTASPNPDGIEVVVDPSHSDAAKALQGVGEGQEKARGSVTPQSKRGQPSGWKSGSQKGCCGCFGSTPKGEEIEL